MEFGFLNEQKTYASKYFAIEPLLDIQTRVQKIKDTFYIENGWLYPPYERNGDGVATKPSVWYDVFSSHTLKIKPSKNIHKEFVLFSVLFFGFLKGMQLVPKGHGKFYKTPFEKGKLTGFIVLDEDICEIMDMAAEFYLKNYYKKQVSKRYYAAVFWFLYGQSYTYNFEKFEAQYRVIDGIFAICRDMLNNPKFKDKELRHSDRIPLLCEHFNIPTPLWGKKDKGNSSIVCRLRNSLVHNTIFAGEPIGYSLPKENYSFEFPRLNEKLLLSLIGVKPEVFTKEHSRCQYLVSLKGENLK